MDLGAMVMKRYSAFPKAHVLFEPHHQINVISRTLVVGGGYPSTCCVLTFWPGQKCHSEVMHRKEVTHSNGSYERKSRGRKLADEMGRAKKFPWYTHRLMHRKRVTSELHDSYFRLMRIKHSISKIEWASNDYITLLSSSCQWSWGSDGVARRVPDSWREMW